MKKKRHLQTLSLLGIVLALFITTIGYSAFNSELSISGEALVRSNHIIRIVDLNLYSNDNGGYEQYNSHHLAKTIDFHIDLPQANSSVTYKVSIENGTEKDYGIALVSGLPDHLTYEFSNYNIGDKLCTGNVCNNNNIDEVYLTIKYKENGYDSSNTTYSETIRLDFEFFSSIIYKGVPNSSNLKQTVLKRTDYTETIPLPQDYHFRIKMNGIPLTKDTDYFYNSTTSLLTIPDVTGNIIIEIEPPSVEFDTSETGNNQTFVFRDTGYEINENTFFLEADFATIDMSKQFENIISIGTRVDDWSPLYSSNGANLHIYYPVSTDTTHIEIDLIFIVQNPETGARSSKQVKFQKRLLFSDSSLFRMAFNSNGLYMNGDKIFDRTGLGPGVTSNYGNVMTYIDPFFANFDNFETNGLTVDIGSKEGSNRSNAVYNDIKIFNELYTVQELIEKTTIESEEIPEQGELTYSEVSTVKLNWNEPAQLTLPFQPNDGKFLFTFPNFIDLSTNSIYVKMDVSNLKENALKENLISLGNDFANWTGEGRYNLHLFYPEAVGNNTLIVALLNGANMNMQMQSSITLKENKYIKMAFSYNGLYINGEKWADPLGNTKPGAYIFGNINSASTVSINFFEIFTYPPENIQFLFGSQQGSNRSSATYEDVRVYTGRLSEEDMIELTN